MAGARAKLRLLVTAVAVAVALGAFPETSRATSLFERLLKAEPQATPATASTSAQGEATALRRSLVERRSPPPAKKTLKTCGVNPKSRSARILVSGRVRKMEANGCPGYDWRRTGRPSVAIRKAVFVVPLSPKMSLTRTNVAFGGCVSGPTGFALNGIPFAPPCSPNSNDVVLSNDIDSCGGAITVEKGYIYPAIPGSKNAAAVAGSQNNRTILCSNAFWRETPRQHSPLLGFMADGIPIYGPRARNGAVPGNLDVCNGHDTDKRFYHYHATTNYPYLPGCLSGCVNSSSWRFGPAACSAQSTQYDYSLLRSVRAT